MKQPPRIPSVLSYRLGDVASARPGKQGDAISLVKILGKGTVLYYRKFCYFPSLALGKFLNSSGAC
jgi:hypothetical protein